MGASFVELIDGSESCSNGSLLGYWGLIIWIFIALYMFVGLYVLCEKYFVPTLTIIGDKMGLSEDVCGATLMAAGSSSPEFLLAIIGTFFFAEENSGPSSNCAAAVFNMCVVIGLSIICSGFQSLELRSFPFVRDSFFYGLSALFLYFFYEVISPGLMEIWESSLLVSIWIFYVLVAYFDLSVRNFIVKIGRSLNILNESTEETIMHTYLLLPQISQIYLNVPKSKYNLTFAKSSVMKAMSRLSIIDENAPLLKGASFQQLMKEEENENDWDWDETQGIWVNTAKRNNHSNKINNNYNYNNNNNNNNSINNNNINADDDNATESLLSENDRLISNSSQGYNYDTIDMGIENLYDTEESAIAGSKCELTIVDSLTHANINFHVNLYDDTGNGHTDDNISNNDTDNDNGSEYDEIGSDASNDSKLSCTTEETDCSICSDSSFDTSLSQSENKEFGPMITSFLKTVDGKKKNKEEDHHTGGEAGSSGGGGIGKNKSRVLSCCGIVKHGLGHGFHLLEKPYEFLFERTVPSLVGKSNVDVRESDMEVTSAEDASSVRLTMSFILWYLSVCYFLYFFC